MRRKHVIAMVVGIALLGLVWLLFVCQEYSVYDCQECLATKQVSQWRVGIWPDRSLPLWPERDEVSQSQILRDFFTPAHEHEWLFRSGTSCYLGVRIYADGSGARRSMAAYAYDGDPAFRAFIQQRIRTGALTRDDFLRAARAPFSLGGGEAPEVQRDYERAVQLVTEYDSPVQRGK